MEETGPATQAEQTGEVGKRLLSNILKVKAEGQSAGLGIPVKRTKGTDDGIRCHTV